MEHLKLFERLLTTVGLADIRESYPGEYGIYLKAHVDSQVFTQARMAVLLAQKAMAERDALQFGIDSEKDSILYDSEMIRFVPPCDRPTVEGIIVGRPRECPPPRNPSCVERVNMPIPHQRHGDRAPYGLADGSCPPHKEVSIMTGHGGLALALLLGLLAAVGWNPTPAIAAGPAMYGVDFVSAAARGYAMNDQGMVAGVRTVALPPGCIYSSTCTFVTETVVWSGDTVIPLPLLPGYSTVTPVSINASGWVAGYAGDPRTTGSRAVVWKPEGTGYTIINLGVLDSTTISWAAGIDDQGRAVGWTTDDPTFPRHTALFV